MDARETDTTKLKTRYIKSNTDLFFSKFIKPLVSLTIANFCKKKGTDLFFRAGSRPALPSSLDSKPSNPLYFVYESAIARQLAALQTLTDQG